MNVLKTVIKKINRAVLLTAICLLTLTTVFAVSSENHEQPPTDTGGKMAPNAKFDRIWVDYDVTEDGEEGMRIHLKFTTYELKGIDSAIRIYFQTKDGTNLKDKNQKFYSQAGYVSVFNDIKPGYDPAVYEDLQTFMPYDEFDLDDGKYDLKMDVDLILEDGTLIQHLTFKEFTYTQEDDDEKEDSSKSKVNKVWIDYDVTDNGRKGLRIHVDFEVAGLKGVDAKILARVQKTNGDYLLSKSSYSNNDGELETSYSIKPGYDTTVYEDAVMFLPYSEINLPKGVWKLKLDIDVSRESGELLEHLIFKEFDYTTPGTVTNGNGNGSGSGPAVKVAPPVKNGISATAKKVWVDYDVMENGKKGMRVHVNFEVTGLKLVDAKLVIRVYKEGGEFLAGNAQFANSDGEFQVSSPVKPTQTTAAFSDVSMFIPYNELIIKKGVWNLTLDVDLSYADGELIQHLESHEFEFTK